MKKDELYKDQGLRQALQHRNEVAKKLTPSADFADSLMSRIQASEVAPQSKRRRLWTYVSIGAVAASIVLLLSVGIHLIPQQGGEPILMAQTDTIKAEPKASTVKERPLQKAKTIEVVDTLKLMKEKYRMPRPPRHYMAKAETVEKTPEPQIDDAELMARALFEQEQQALMQVMAENETKSSLQDDFESIIQEIRRRGEHTARQVEIALSNEE